MRGFTDFLVIVIILALITVTTFSHDATASTNHTDKQTTLKLDHIFTTDTIVPWYCDSVFNNDTLVPMFDSIITMVLHHEGSRFVHDTAINEVSRRGITLAVYRQYYGHGDYNSIRNLTEQQAKDIYESLFWDANNLDSLVLIGYPKTAAVLLDSEVNVGPNRANKYFQRSLGMTNVNGLIDSTTLAYLRESELTDEALSQCIINTRRRFYDRLVANRPVFQRYHRGWNNRLNSMEEFVANI